MKKAPLITALFIAAALACNGPMSVTPETAVPTTSATALPVEDPVTPTPEEFIPLTQAVPPTLVPTAVQPLAVSVDSLTIVLPPGLASGVHGVQVPRAEGQDLPYWEITPGHMQFVLEGYLLQDKLHEPGIYVYPAADYAQMVPSAFESIHRLDNILYSPGGPTVTDETQLPAVPFFNAAQVFTSKVQVISFQAGGGVRFLTEYAQSAAPVNNHELFYHFQGVTRDGAYYVIAILPIVAPALAETSEPGAFVPQGGVAYPDFSEANADIKGYYSSITDLLNSTSPEAFAPAITQLDALIQSIKINP